MHIGGPQVSNKKTSTKSVKAKAAAREAAKEAAAKAAKLKSAKDARAEAKASASHEPVRVKRYEMGDDVEEILEVGSSFKRPSNLVWLLVKDEDFEVETGSGVVDGEPGDAVAFDQVADSLYLIRADQLDSYVAVATGDDGHEHLWQPGVLPGDKRVRICTVDECGVMEQIDRDAWEALRLGMANPMRMAAPGRNYGG